MSVANLNIPISEFMDLKKKLAELQAKIEFSDEKNCDLNKIFQINSKKMSPNKSNVRVKQFYLQPCLCWEEMKERFCSLCFTP